MPKPLAQLLSAERVRFEAVLEGRMRSMDGVPGRLLDAMNHSLLGGGKRLRPVMLLWTFRSLAAGRNEVWAASEEDALLAACGIECLHTYSLIHDDLPAMDDDRLRRGRPTCHVAFDEATAILAGDGLQALGFGWLAQAGGPRAGALVSLAAASLGPAGMVGGQQLDLDAEGRETCPQAIARIQRLKTGRMLGLALGAGAILGGADEALVANLDRAGQALGIAFQGADDLLDAEGVAATLGKTPGKDAEAGKATMIRAAGLEQARAWTRRHGEEGLELLRACLGNQKAAGPLLELGAYLWRRNS